MAPKDETESGFHPIPDSEGWETVHEESGQQLDLQPGDTFVGVYTGVRELATTDVNGEDRLANLYEFSSEGKKYSLWGSYNLDVAFEKIAPGEIVRVQFVGENLIKGGSQRLKEYRVDRKPA